MTVGEVDGWLWYDALVDPELALAVLEKVAPDESATTAMSVGRATRPSSQSYAAATSSCAAGNRCSGASR